MEGITEEESRSLETIISSLSARLKREISFEALVQAWSDFIAQVEKGYDYSIYDYTNDLSVRDMIQEIITHVDMPLQTKLSNRIRPWDDSFFKATQVISRPLLSLESGTPSVWWFRVPRNLAGELKKDLRSEGLINN